MAELTSRQTPARIPKLPQAMSRQVVADAHLIEAIRARCQTGRPRRNAAGQWRSFYGADLRCRLPWRDHRAAEHLRPKTGQPPCATELSGLGLGR